VAVVSKDPVESGSERRLTATQQKGAAYQGAMEAVFAILIAAGLGYWADEYFGTTPWYLVIGVVVGFSAFVVRLLRLGEHVKEFSEQAGPASGDGQEQGQEEEREKEQAGRTSGNQQEEGR
jgi:ATP synthase protein I